MTIQRETNYRVTCDHVFRWIEFDQDAPRVADLDPNAQVWQRPCETSHLHRGEDLDAAERAYREDGWRPGPADKKTMTTTWLCPAHAPADDVDQDALSGHPLQSLAAGLSRAAEESGD